MNKAQLSQFIKSEALKHGFSECGIARVRRLDEHEPRLADWLKNGMNGSMHYMERNFDKRLDPRMLVEGAKSVISLMMGYYPPTPNINSELKVSKYAWNVDYHFVIKERLFHMADRIKEQIGDFNFRIFVDSAPILDRAWAVEAGIGWIGRNSMLISKKHGSFYFLAEIVTDLEPEFDTPFGGNYCGDCRRCIESCPTNAIKENKTIDANVCISYLTIELNDQIENAFNGYFKDWIFGCDICQDVCPWNKFSIIHDIDEFKPIGEWTEWTRDEWRQMDRSLFNHLFRKSALKRAGFEKLKNSINFVTQIKDNEYSGDIKEGKN